MMKIAITTERHDLHSLAYAAIRAGNSQNVSDVERCCDIFRYLMGLNLSVKDLCHSKAILPLASLREHENPKIRRKAHVLFNSWMKTLYSGGRNSSTCDNAPPLNLQKASVVKVCSELKKNKHQISPDITAAESKKKTEFLVSMKNEGKRSQAHESTAKLLQTKTHLVKLSERPKLCPALKSVRDDDCKSVPTKFRRTQKKSVAVQVISNLEMTDGQRFRALETGEIKQYLMKPKDCKSIVARSIQAQKRSTLPMKKKQLPLKMSQKNSTEMLELFDIAKRSADKANAKGLLASEAETSICVETLSLLKDYPISSTATETRRIVLRLEHLTKHKDRRICNSASALLHYWRQSFKDQDQRESRKTQW